MESISLENSHLKVRFDAASGGVAGLLNKKTGLEWVQSESGPELFRLILPTGKWRGHHIDSNSQKVKLAVSGKEVRGEYQGLVSPLGRFDIKVRFKASLDGDELRFSFEVHNGAPLCITEFWFPRVRGLRPAARAGESTLLIPDTLQSQFLKNPYDALYPERWSTGGKRTWLYPQILQFAELYDDNEGLYFACYNNAPRVRALVAERETVCSTGFELAWVQYPHLDQGESIHRCEYVIALHRGDWHDGARRYREWLESWVRPCEISPEVRESIGWHFAFLKLQDGTLVRSYEDLKALHASASKYGINSIQLFGWTEGGMDRQYPDIEPIKEFGGVAGMRSALMDIRKAGGRVSLYIPCSLGHLNSKRHKDDIDKMAVMGGTGRPIRLSSGSWQWTPYDTNTWYDNQAWVRMCFASDWRHLVTRHAQYCIEELGATGVHLDQAGTPLIDLCYSRAHEHDKPDQIIEGLWKMWRDVRKSVKQAYPDATVHAEGLCELSGEYVDVHWGWYKDPRPDVMRSVLPGYLLTDQIQENEYLRAGQAFVYGRPLEITIRGGLGSIGEFPEFGAFICRLAALRKELKEFFCYGRFRDDLDVRVSPEIQVKSHVAPSGVAIGLLNQSRNPIQGEISLDPEQIGVTGCDSVEIYGVDKRRSLPFRGEITADLGPHEMRVAVLRRQT